MFQIFLHLVTFFIHFDLFNLHICVQIQRSTVNIHFRCPFGLAQGVDFSGMSATWVPVPSCFASHMWLSPREFQKFPFQGRGGTWLFRLLWQWKRGSLRQICWSARLG